MKYSEDIKMEIGGKFINDEYKYVHQLVDDLNKLCKQVRKEQCAINGVVRPNLTDKHPVEGVNEPMQINTNISEGQLNNNKCVVCGDKTYGEPFPVCNTCDKDENLW
jgi:hypothetical protein